MVCAPLRRCQFFNLTGLLERLHLSGFESFPEKEVARGTGFYCDQDRAK